MGPTRRSAQDLNSLTPHRSEMQLHILAAFRLFTCQRAQTNRTRRLAADRFVQPTASSSFGRVEDLIVTRTLVNRPSELFCLTRSDLSTGESALIGTDSIRRNPSPLRRVTRGRFFTCGSEIVSSRHSLSTGSQTIFRVADPVACHIVCDKSV